MFMDQIRISIAVAMGFLVEGIAAYNYINLRFTKRWQAMIQADFHYNEYMKSHKF